MENTTRPTLNLQALKILADRYGFTVHYIKTILWETRTPKFADQVKLEYKEAVDLLDKIASQTNLKPIK